jgi:hypothetical protein
MADQIASVAAVVIHPGELKEWVHFLDQTESDQSRSEAINPLRGDVTLLRDGRSEVRLRFAICD